VLGESDTARSSPRRALGGRCCFETAVVSEQEPSPRSGSRRRAGLALRDAAVSCRALDRVEVQRARERHTPLPTYVLRAQSVEADVPGPNAVKAAPCDLSFPHMADVVDPEAFRAWMAPKVAAIRAFTSAVDSVADRHGGRPAAESRAMSELDVEQRYSARSTWEMPITPGTP
jgi:hypothetical protein